MPEAILAEENIIHIGATRYLAGFLFRDQIMLRALIIAGDVIYVLYFFLAPETPLWGGIFWSVIFVLVNSWMIARIVADRMHFDMTDEEKRLFAVLENLTPGEFRRLVQSGTWHTAAEPTVLIRENEPLDCLFYVVDGAITVEKAGRILEIAPGTFIGEVAYLLSRPASGTVTVGKGARYISWPASSLNRLVLRAPSLSVALTAALNRDMAAKVARA